MEKKLCITCGIEFDGRKNRLYCSENCKMKAFYNGNGEKRTVLQLDEPINDNVVKPLTNIEMKSVESLNAISILLSPLEKDLLTRQAEDCGVELSKFIRVRALMDETNTSKLEASIEKLQSENDELRIQISFFRKGNHQEVQKHEVHSGIFIEMNQKQNDFLEEKWLESLDYEGSSGEWELSDGTFSTNQKEIEEDFEIQSPGSIKESIAKEMLEFMFADIEKKLVEHNNYNNDEFKYNPLLEEYDDLSE